MTTMSIATDLDIVSTFELNEIDFVHSFYNETNVKAKYMHI
jgi:hypothetical protein